MWANARSGPGTSVTGTQAVRSVDPVHLVAQLAAGDPPNQVEGAQAVQLSPAGNAPVDPPGPGVHAEQALDPIGASR